MKIDASRTRVAGVLLVGVLVGVLLTSPVTAHVTSKFGHLWGEHIKPRLSAPGTVNAPRNPVNWGQLKNVPDGIADGVDAGQTNPSSRRTWVMPHVFESKGLTSSQTTTSDVLVSAVCRRGITGGCGGGMLLDIYLFDDQGEPTTVGDSTGAAVAVCNPCTFPLGGNVRKQTIRIDDLITRKGTFDSSVKLGYGVIVVNGTDADAVAIQGFVVNSHTSPFDLTISPLELQEVPEASPSG